MTLDPTGLYAKQAQATVRCPICGALPGRACDLTKQGEIENAVHVERLGIRPNPGRDRGKR